MLGAHRCAQLVFDGTSEGSGCAEHIVRMTATAVPWCPGVVGLPEVAGDVYCWAVGPEVVFAVTVASGWD